MATRNPLQRAAAGTAAVGLAVALAACTSSEGATDDGEGDTAAPVTLANSQWLDAARGDALWDSVAAYEETGRGTVERVEIPNSEIETRLTTELGSGAGPDVMFVQDTVFLNFVDAGFLAPLDSAVEGADLNATNEGGVIDGERLGVAWQRAPFGFMYNAAILEEAGVEVPTSVDELIAAVETIEANTDAIGFGDQTPLAGHGIWTQGIDTWTYGAGGAWATEDGELTIDSPENVAGFEAIKQMQDAGIFASDDFDTMRMMFAQGQVAMMSDHAGGALISSLEGVVDPADIGVAPNPMPNPGYHEQLYVVVNQNSENLDAALDFVSWLVSEEGQLSVRGASGADPLATDVPISDEYAAQYPWAEGFLEIGQTTTGRLIPGHEMQTSQIMQTMLENLQLVLSSDVTSEEALATVQAEAEALG